MEPLLWGNRQMARRRLFRSQTARIAIEFNQDSAFLDLFGLIEPQDEFSDPAFRTQRYDHGAIEAEMIAPLLLSRIEEVNKLIGFKIDRCNIATFEGIAIWTAQT
jgi:hypothetical protein